MPVHGPGTESERAGAATPGSTGARRWTAPRDGPGAPFAMLGFLGVLLLLAAGPAAAQGRLGGGLGLAFTVPRGELGDNVGAGLGLGGQLLYGLDPAGALALRLDGALVTYGSERFRRPLSRTVSRVSVDVQTRNNIFLLGFGPQLALPAGPVRPYLNGAVGLGYFFTESSVEGSGNFDFQDFARTTNFDDLSFAYGVGGGLGIALGSGPRPVRLALDLQYRDHGRTRYLREGSIEEDGTGRVFIRPLESDADLFLLQVGVSFGF